MKQSTTLSMGTTIAGNPYLIQAAEYITPGLPYFAAIGIDDEDRHIRERVQTACETVGYAWPEGRTTLALMPTNQPKRPGLCALADAIQEQMIYQALCREATTRGKWIER